MVYTNDSLQQLLEIRVFDVMPDADVKEWRSSRTWNQTESVAFDLPSRQFIVSSPSSAIGTASPAFAVDGPEVQARIHWMEHPAPRDDSKLVQPDVIRLDVSLR